VARAWRAGVCGKGERRRPRLGEQRGPAVTMREYGADTQDTRDGEGERGSGARDASVLFFRPSATMMKAI
jgi:hypothetical protein